MSSPDEAPKLNPWPFLGGDVALLGAAAAIGHQAPAPLGVAALVAISGCVGLGAVLACVPFLLNHTRRQEMALAERQNEIAALAQTTAASAEQLSVAAAGLHTIADTAARAVKHAEQLPARLQEKINEFKTQLNEVAVTDNEALAQEVDTLRASETERLETALTAVKKTAAELVAAETSARKQMEALGQTLQRFTATLEQSASGGAARLGAQHTAAERSLVDAQGAAVRAIEEACARATAQLVARIDTATSAAEARSVALAATTVMRVPVVEDDRVPAASEIPVLLSRPAASAAAVVVAPVEKPLAAEFSAPSVSDGDAMSTPAEPGSTPPMVATAPTAPTTSPSVSVATPAAIVSATVVEVPVAAKSVAGTDGAANGASAGVSAEGSAAEAGVSVPAARKRSTRKSAFSDDEPSLGLDLSGTYGGDDYSQVAPEETRPPAAVSADGVTRLLVTAYIGIGNKLFVRGDGPGLSRERGVPLQFISIGKWRWETAEAVTPVVLRVYKNDEQECASLGEISLEPGRQQEVTAKF